MDGGADGGARRGRAVSGAREDCRALLNRWSGTLDRAYGGSTPRGMRARCALTADLISEPDGPVVEVRLGQLLVAEYAGGWEHAAAGIRLDLREQRERDREQRERETPRCRLCGAPC